MQKTQIAVKDLKSSRCSYLGPDIAIKIVLWETGGNSPAVFFSPPNSTAKSSPTKAED